MHEYGQLVAFFSEIPPDEAIENELAMKQAKVHFSEQYLFSPFFSLFFIIVTVTCLIPTTQINLYRKVPEFLWATCQRRHCRIRRGVRHLDGILSHAA